LIAARRETRGRVDGAKGDTQTHVDGVKGKQITARREAAIDAINNPSTQDTHPDVGAHVVPVLLYCCDARARAGAYTTTDAGALYGTHGDERADRDDGADRFSYKCADRDPDGRADGRADG
jgi:hypothetical protein